MAITFGTPASAITRTNSSVTYSLTVGSYVGSAVLVVGLNWGNLTTSTPNASYNGISMQRVCQSANNGRNSVLFKLVNPPIGTYNVYAQGISNGEPTCSMGVVAYGAYDILEQGYWLSETSVASSDTAPMSTVDSGDIGIGYFGSEDTGGDRYSSAYGSSTLIIKDGYSWDSYDNIWGVLMRAPSSSGTATPGVNWSVSVTAASSGGVLLSEKFEKPLLSSSYSWNAASATTVSGNLYVPVSNSAVVVVGISSPNTAQTGTNSAFSGATTISGSALTMLDNPWDGNTTADQGVMAISYIKYNVEAGTHSISLAGSGARRRSFIAFSVSNLAASPLYSHSGTWVGTGSPRSVTHSAPIGALALHISMGSSLSADTSYGSWGTYGYDYTGKYGLQWYSSTSRQQALVVYNQQRVANPTTYLYWNSPYDSFDFSYVFRSPAGGNKVIWWN